ncbi:Do family serine endopeptidase [Bradyrhizobium sp. AUGA SZCCT0240]|uniref:Do family serine endopeptidase n=1 Tax=unclassified Bradyrhizobium TaxID=2631580 RepID=UPI001BA606CC|nr:MULTISPECIES: Do family serine endopeptidase [unclassified Bradyrhizobium]MBR1187519.1 Do family serine endopeptidase [Bradyrhizobium sp. AUGA SZCCT0160]MBR1197308.1 Do family serine endopeptidase [Bradyrhizobium sp. AUGA SZCCT0158]MBR1239772.1 Do family serine endopeptidase [Bradyrhizobium sp. AUGA SZCCT0274]MBR1255062.1 Do family serine endopeptidase [Bradyrhizobium sp. AUGA SZCCT0240]
MTGARPALSRRLRMMGAAISLGAAGALASAPAFARGPDGIADIAEKVIDAVVNISTSQNVEAKGGGGGGDRQATPQLPPGSPFEEFFDDFFKNRRGGAPKGGERSEMQPRKTNSLGSGFIIDTAGVVVTNNHVIADADEINIIMNDGTKIRAELVGVDKKTDIAVLKFKPVKPLVAVKFGESDKLRLGEWVIAIGNPFSLGGSVTAGIVSARNRDISQGPYDSYIQTDASINRGNSGGPLFNLEGEVVGVNTLIISPTGGSIGLGFAVPSKTVIGVVNQLREFGELRRGWLGVRIQQVTDEIAESLNIKPARGALVAGIDDKGPAKPAGIEPGDVVVKFDGKDVKDPKDLSRVVADTAVGKEVEVVVIRKGAEETKKVTLGRLEDNEKVQQAAAKSKDEPAAEKPVTQKVLGLDLAALSKDLRGKYKIKDSVKGVVITGVDNASDAAEKRLSAGDVIVEVAQEAVTNTADVKKRVDQIKKDGRKSVLLMVANGEGELRFVPLLVQ